MEASSSDDANSDEEGDGKGKFAAGWGKKRYGLPCDFRFHFLILAINGWTTVYDIRARCVFSEYM